MNANTVWVIFISMAVGASIVFLTKWSRKKKTKVFEPADREKEVPRETVGVGFWSNKLEYNRGRLSDPHTYRIVRSFEELVYVLGEYRQLEYVCGGKTIIFKETSMPSGIVKQEITFETAKKLRSDVLYIKGW